MRILILILILGLVAGPVWAIDDKGYAMGGLASQSCGKIVELEEKSPEYLRSSVASHINGYITAFNFLKRGKADWTDGANPTSLTLFVTNYCRDHPLKLLDDGVIALMREFDPTFGPGAF
jgi:hypothetical protein